MPASDAACVITGVGLRCSVGQNVVQSGASIRARVNRFIEWPYLKRSGPDAVAFIVAPVLPLLPDQCWAAKLEALALQPLLEALWMAGLAALLNDPPLARWGLYLALPGANREGMRQGDTEALDFLVEWKQLGPVKLDTLELFGQGHAAALFALERARQELTGGRHDVCVVGGVDSLLHTAYLSHLASTGKLKSSADHAGVIPGEAAAFVVLETRQHAARRGAEVLAEVMPAHVGHEPEPAGAPTVADALSGVLRAAVADSPTGPKAIRRVLTDLNGETWRFREGGLADTRSLSILLSDWQLWHPADCVGDVGTATGAVLCCVAVRAFQRRYAIGQAIVLATSADSGERAALCLLAPPAPRGGLT